MIAKNKIRNPVELHHEMYELRRRDTAWFHGRTLKQVIRDMGYTRVMRIPPRVKPDINAQPNNDNRS